MLVAGWIKSALVHFYVRLLKSFDVMKLLLLCLVMLYEFS